MISSNRNHNRHFRCNIIVISDYFHDYIRCLISYHVISCQRYGLVCKVKDNYRNDLPIDWLLSYLYTYDDLSVCLFHKHERKMCWNTASDVAAIISHINGHFRLTIVRGFFLTSSFQLQLQMTLIGQQLDDKHPIKLTQARDVGSTLSLDVGSMLWKWLDLKIGSK